MTDEIANKVISENITNGITHASQFHADDVFATAFLLMLNPRFTYKRTNIIPNNFNGLLYDIGFGKYDHHQKIKEYRENGIPYATFGLLWRDFAKYLKFDGKYLSDITIKAVDRSLIQGLDKSDNTGSKNELSNIVGKFNPSNDKQWQSNERFAMAVEWAKTALYMVIESALQIEKNIVIVKESLRNLVDDVLFLDKCVGITEPNIYKMLSENNVNFVVYQSNRCDTDGTPLYNMQQVPISEKDTVGKVPFPNEWLGEERNKLPSPITFCHSGNWLLAFKADGKNEAIKIACKISKISKNGGDKTGI